MGCHCTYYTNIIQLDMEYMEGAVKDSDTEKIYHNDYEQASNSYLMSVVALIGGLPMPIINFIASVIFYLGSRRSSYFVRWHSIQSALGQLVLVPFNSIAFAWTLRIILNNEHYTIRHDDIEAGIYIFEEMSHATLYYWFYIAFIILLNLVEFFVVVYTASRVRNGNHVRWLVLGNLADSLTSKENRDPYRR